MAKPKRDTPDGNSPKPKVNLPKDALARINLGNSFAEYDKTLKDSYAFVKTPALSAALEAEWSKCFFVGRRGTGKTAITYYLGENNHRTIQLHPQIIAPETLGIDPDELKDVRRQPFAALKLCFRRVMQDEVIAEWVRKKLIPFSKFPPGLLKERNFIEEDDFTLRLIRMFEETYPANSSNRAKDWVRQKNRTLEIGREMDSVAESKNWSYILLIDKIDEAWDGDDKAVTFLMALMHACVEVTASVKCFRPLLFLRENIYERVRQVDTEFARLETSVVSMDWTQELLLELVERRLNLPFPTKLPLRGPTWDYFFESVEGKSSRSVVFQFCQERPRDVLIYCSSAIDAAKAHRHPKVQIEDLQEARRQFSDRSLKDLGDEYSENYPQIQLVLSRFYGLGREFTLPGITSFIKKLLMDSDVISACGSWLFKNNTPELFIELLYQIGFIGVVDGQEIRFRSLGVRSATPPPITLTTRVVIHPSYMDALSISDKLVENLDDTVALRSSGILEELPDGFDIHAYQNKLLALDAELKVLAPGDETAEQFEAIVGEFLKLCFYKHFTNIQHRVRNHSGVVVRDWIVSNLATAGFWEVIRQRYNAMHVIWECKNFDTLGADVFQQINYYINKQIGVFVVVVFRGERKKWYHQHIKRIAEHHNGMVLLLEDKDLITIMRQARKGKDSDNHLRDIFDDTIHAIS